jgi:hypothetical protein
MKVKKALAYFISEICCFAVIGYILMGSSIFQFNSTAIFFTIFAITAILLFTILEIWTIREFIYLGILISLFIVYVWSRNKSLPEIIRNSLWFITIGGFTWISHKVMKSWNPQKLRFVPLVVWIISFNCIYLIMLLFNLYIFRFYRITEDFTFVFYLKQALKYGTVVGLSIGLGYFLAEIIIKDFKILNK